MNCASFYLEIWNCGFNDRITISFFVSLLYLQICYGLGLSSRPLHPTVDRVAAPGWLQGEFPPFVVTAPAFDRDTKYDI